MFQRPWLEIARHDPLVLPHASRRLAASRVVCRQNRGPQPPDRRGGPQQRGGRGQWPSSPQPRERLIDLSEAAEWWRKNVFRGVPVGPIQPAKLANGHVARPGTSTAGQPIEVITNHLLLNVNIQEVGQYEVTVLRLPHEAPSGASTPETDGGGSSGGGGRSDSTGRGSSRTADAKSRGGGGGRRKAPSSAGTKVSGQEAHAVLSYLLDITPSGDVSPVKDAWVYDGAVALYAARLSDVRQTLGGDGEERFVRQPDGSVLVDVPPAAGGPAAGAKYEVRLRLITLMDVRDWLMERQRQECQRQERQRQRAAAPSTAEGPSAEVDAEAEAQGEEAGADTVPGASVPRAGSEQAAMAVLDLISRARAAWGKDTVRAGPGTYVSYNREDRENKISGALPLKLLGGFRSAVAAAAGGLTLTVDVASAVVAEDGPLLPQIEKAELGGPSGSSRGGDLAKKLQNASVAAKLEPALAGLEVKSSHSNITYRLSGKLGEPARKLKFSFENDEITVEKYFKDKYAVVLQRPDLPCALDRKGAALPLELLTVLRSQKRTARLDARQKATLIRATARRPDDRLRAIRELLRGPLRLGEGVSKVFGLGAAAVDFLRVRARLLPGPLLEVTRSPSRGGLAPGNEGEWSLSGVAASGTWKSGAVLSYVDSEKHGDTVTKLLDQLRGSLATLAAAEMPRDMPVVWASPPKSDKDPIKEAEDWLWQAARRARGKYGEAPQLVLVVLPEGRAGGDVYDAVKAAEYGSLRVTTQCVNPLAANLAKGGPATPYTNLLALGVNAKLGGITTRPAGQPKDWAPVLQGRRLMVLGADVSRGPAAALGGRAGEAGGKDLDPAAAPGIEYAAVVGSVDSHCVRYLQQLSAQSAGNRDVILGMKDSTAALLRQYAASLAGSQVPAEQPPPPTGQQQGPLPISRLPEVLLMYRDGVADTMFDAVLAQEYEAIKEACVAVGGPGYDPRVTFVVVQKSHNTRLFPATKEDAHKSGNVRPGTAVDQGVVDEAAFEFFLNSHAGIQGTNRAPRYSVLVDQVGFTSESLQLLTFALCHTYPACNRSLSLPPPARLADRAADRARKALKHKVSRPTTAGASWYELLQDPVDASSVV